MNDHQLFWGCAHSQFHASRHLQFESGYPEGSWRAFVERGFEFASGHIDFFPCIYYPAYTYRLGGRVSNESVGPRDEFSDEWGTILELVESYNTPGSLVTFPGYEWTGNRRRWGDHNVIYRDPHDAPLELCEDIDSLYAHVRTHRGMAIPHHTGYAVGYRGKDWGHFDPLLSPVAEIYSVHGSSEGVVTPFDMRSNIVMGPRVSGGTIQDGLDAGHRFGIIASGDNDSGYPGRWGSGLAGVWADDLSRESIWRAITERRTYGVTGDRMRLEFYANGSPMGSDIAATDGVEFHGTVVGSDAIDRVELLRNGRVIATKNHRGSWEHVQDDRSVSKLRLEFGWGPQPGRGLPVADRRWTGSLVLEGGKLIGTEGCFTRGPYSLVQDGNACSWTFTTSPAVGSATGSSQQAIVLEFAGRPEVVLSIGEGRDPIRVPWSSVQSETKVFPDLESSRRLLSSELGSVDFENAEMRAYGSSYKTLMSKSVPREAYDLEFSFTDTPGPDGAYYYVRVQQENGQMAWSSPIWVTEP